MVLNSYEGWTRHQTTCPDPALLTPLEAAQLPEGATVEVTWSGGNGPHQYEVRLGPGAQPYAGDVRNDNPLTGLEAFVGDRSYHTHVRRLDREAQGGLIKAGRWILVDEDGWHEIVDVESTTDDGTIALVYRYRCGRALEAPPTRAEARGPLEPPREADRCPECLSAEPTDLRYLRQRVSDPPRI